MVTMFVYGTLKPGEAYHDRYCRPHLVQATQRGCKGGFTIYPWVTRPSRTRRAGWWVPGCNCGMQRH
jgi:gamma-glutamylcyclotransferase (GGCT)/AIG2-like uncharacterized protein YtfP